MPDKEGAPRLKPHLTAGTSAEIPRPLNPDQQRKIGQMSLTNGTPIVRKTPSEIA